MIQVPILRITATRCPDPKREAECNEWYSKVHVREVLARIPGVKSGTRYEVVDPGPGEAKWVTLYEMTDPGDIENYVVKVGKGQVPGFTPGPPLQRIWRANVRLLKI